MKKQRISVEINNPLDDTSAAMVLIDRFFRKNKIDNYNLIITYDYELNDCGCYFPKCKNLSERLYVNPLNCKTQEDIQSQNWVEPFCPGSPCDMTLFSVTIHEFCHFLQYKVYPTIIKDFSKDFPENRFYLNQYSNHEIRDELAEIMTFMITNPYLLKLISEPHFIFCKRYFKSPVSCTSKQCLIIYEGFPIEVKENIKKKWGIIYNYSENNFVKI